MMIINLGTEFDDGENDWLLELIDEKLVVWKGVSVRRILITMINVTKKGLNL